METNFLESRVLDSAVMKALFRKTYIWMTMALLITALSALITAKSPALLSLVYGSRFGVWVLVQAQNPRFLLHLFFLVLLVLVQVFVE